MHNQVLSVLQDELSRAGIESTLIPVIRISPHEYQRSWLSVKRGKYDYKIKLLNDQIIIMLKQCININGLIQKSPYGKIYETIKIISLEDPQCFEHVIADLKKSWFLTDRSNDDRS